MINYDEDTDVLKLLNTLRRQVKHGRFNEIQVGDIPSITEIEQDNINDQDNISLPLYINTTPVVRLEEIPTVNTLRAKILEYETHPMVDGLNQDNYLIIELGYKKTKSKEIRA